MDTDVIVVGAGVAGLAAARALAAEGRSIVVVEARDRVGGRVLTRHEGGTTAIELGAEFVHEATPAFAAALEAAGLATVDVSGEHWSDGGDRIGPVPFDDAIAEFTEEARHEPGAVGDVLRRLAPAWGARLEGVRRYVEGFHAADPDRLDAGAFVAQEDASEMPRRPVGGYDQLVRWLLAGLDPARDRLRLGFPVGEVRWKAGAVEVEGPAGVLHAPRVVLTVPLGVWLAGGLRFTPDIGKQQALAALVPGDAVRVVMRFRARFWEEGLPKAAAGAADASFFHGNGAFLFAAAAPSDPTSGDPSAPEGTAGAGLPDATPRSSAVAGAFPTFWTQLPVRAPVIVAWVGGPRARALAGKPADEVIAAAVSSLSATFGLDVREHLDGAWTHDWATDPWARGAYTYVSAGNRAAPAALRAPVEGTLFFAGEATSDDGGGTVTAAFESGLRAAREILATP